MSNKIKCAHILIEKQSQALQLLEEIKKGKKLEQLPKRFPHVPVEKKKEI